MALSVGIVGLPNVGKSTLFNALSSKRARGLELPVLHDRAQRRRGHRCPTRARRTSRPSSTRSKTVPTVVEFVDIAGLVKGASKGEGLGNQFLGNIREHDAVVHVVRCFEDDNVIHVEGKRLAASRHRDHRDRADPQGPRHPDKRVDRANKAAKGGDKNAKAQSPCWRRCRRT
jgi:ribosome-binding ATPase YchF (GTP1/OBG family)